MKDSFGAFFKSFYSELYRNIMDLQYEGFYIQRKYISSSTSPATNLTVICLKNAFEYGHRDLIKFNYFTLDFVESSFGIIFYCRNHN